MPIDGQQSHRQFPGFQCHTHRRFFTFTPVSLPRVSQRSPVMSNLWQQRRLRGVKFGRLHLKESGRRDVFDGLETAKSPVLYSYSPAIHHICSTTSVFVEGGWLLWSDGGRMNTDLASGTVAGKVSGRQETWAKSQRWYPLLRCCHCFLNDS